MKQKVFLLLFYLLIAQADAKQADNPRAELVSLLKDRKELFDKYSSSLDKKTGFFGNRSKNNILESHEMLLEIVEADNKIIGSLNRTLNYRNFEKLNLSFDASSYENRIRSLTVLNDTLNKQNLKLLVENKSFRTKLKKHTIYFVCLFILFVIPAYIFIRNYFKR